MADSSDAKADDGSIADDRDGVVSGNKSLLGHVGIMTLIKDVFDSTDHRSLHLLTHSLKFEV